MAPSKWAQLSFRPSVSRGERLSPGLRRPAARGAAREDGEERAAPWRLCCSWHWALWAGLGLLWVLVFALQCAHVTLTARGCGWGSLLPCLLQARHGATPPSATQGWGAVGGARLDLTPGSIAGAEPVSLRAAPAGTPGSQGSPAGVPHNGPASLGLAAGAGTGSAGAAGVAQGSGEATTGAGVLGTGGAQGTGAGTGTGALAGDGTGAGGMGRPEVSPEDAELFSRALAAQGTGEPRVALLFLVRGPLPLAPLWAKFLAGHEAHFAVYVHATGGAPASDQHLPAVFQGRHVPSKGSKWGSMSIVDAERRVLANALADPRNSHFVLLSESCAPLFDAVFTLRYLTQAHHSFVDTAQELAWWSESMLPAVPESVLRKGSAWFAMQRQHAHLVVADRAFYQQFAAGWGFGHGYDEHYYQTLLAYHDPARLANRSATYALFKDGKAHPVTYRAPAVTPAFLRGLANATCTWNGRWAVPCFLFARKFAPDALQPLLGLLPLRPFFRELPTEGAAAAAAAASTGALGPGQGGGASEWGGMFDAEDEALFARAVSRKPLGTKVALLFLTSGSLPLAPLWARFLAGSGANFSIYIHAPAHASIDPALPPPFRTRFIPSKASDDGPVPALAAVKRLLAHALLDSRNSHFVLLSQWCAPLWDSELTFRTIVESPRSFVDTTGTPACWSESLSPRIPREQLRSGSPWFAVIRKHAWLVVRDASYYKAFRRGWQCRHGAAQYYCQTLLPRMVAPDLANRSVTYSRDPERGEGPPELAPLQAFEAGDVREESLRSIAAHRCLGPSRVELPCFLFARSFGPGTLEPLLELLPLSVRPLQAV